MSATVYGDINFSLSDETGFYSESVNADITVKAKEVVGGGGEITAGSFYGATGTFSLEGALKTTGSPAWDLGIALTIANSIDIVSLVDGYSSGVKYITLSAAGSLGAESEERRTISGNIYPFLGALQA